MADEKGLLAILGVDTTEYTGDMRKVLRTAKAVDQAHRDMVDSINAAEKALNKVGGGSGAKVKVDTGDIDAAVRLLDDLGGTVSTKVTVDDSDADTDIKQIKSDLGDLKNAAVIDLVFNVADTLSGFVPSSLPFLGTIIDTDEAVRQLNARIGQDIPEAAGIINEVFTAAFGDTREEVAQAVAQVLQIGVAADRAANVTAEAFTVAELAGEDFNTVLQAADALVRNDLAKDFSQAFDIITVGLQNGLNRNEDFLDSLTEYSVQFKELGITGQQALSIISQGLDAGAFNTDKIVDGYKELGVRVRDGFSQSLTGGGPQAEILDKLNFLDEAEAFERGELSGAQMISGLRTAVEEGLAEGTITQQDVFDLFGSAAEDLTIPVFLEIDPLKVVEDVSNIEGATVDAGVTLFGGLNTAIEEAFRTAQTDVAMSISEAFDIPGKLQQLTTGLQTFSGLLRSGEDIPDAIEQAFQIEGFAEGFRNLETVLGDIKLGVLEVVAAILEMAGNQEAAGDVRGLIAEEAQRQLAFDVLFAADETELAAAVSNAMRRGVEESAIGETLEGTIQGLIDGGDIQKANELLDRIEDSSGRIFGAELTPEAIASAEAIRANQARAGFLDQTPQELLDVVERVETAQTISDSFDASNVTEQLEAVEEAQGVFATIGETFAPVGEAFVLIEEGIVEATGVFTEESDSIVTTLSGMASSGEVKLDQFGNIITGFSGGAVTHFDAVERSVQRVLNAIAALSNITVLPTGPDTSGVISSITGGGAVTTSAPAAAGGRRSGSFVAGEQGREIVSSVPEVAVLNNQTSNSILSAVGAFLASAPFSSSNNDNRQQSQVNNVVIQSPAEGFSTVQDINNQIRGFK